MPLRYKAKMSAGTGCLELRKGVRVGDKINWERRKKPEEEKPESSPEGGSV